MTKLLHSNGYDDWETYESSLVLYIATLETLEPFKSISEVLDMPLLYHPNSEVKGNIQASFRLTAMSSPF